MELITNLIPKNSSGYDNLSNKLIKKLLPALIDPLTIVFNKSLAEGIFPEAMKKADVVPLYKSKDHQDSNNYRPISLLLTLSKLLEKIRKLYKYGIRGVAHNWFKSYLNGRQMRVKCNIASSGKTEYSDYREVSYGTPQGSCLGPLIFLIFTNDLHRHLVYSSSILFADDTTVYKTHRNLVYLKWCLEDDLNTLSDWFAANKLTLNLDKTVCMLFQKNNMNKEIILKVKDMTIKNQTETKFLGMWLDQSLSWYNHIQKLTLKIKRNKYLLNNGKHLMDQNTKRLVYYSHIASHLQYGMLLWGNNAGKEQLNKL